MQPILTALGSIRELGSMIFAIATDERSLFVFPSAEQAVAYCEGIDVQAGSWSFWGECGATLEPDFLIPSHHDRFSVGSGTFQLVSTTSHPSLSEVLAGLRSIERNPYFSSLAEVGVFLAAFAPVHRYGD